MAVNRPELPVEISDEIDRLMDLGFDRNDQGDSQQALDLFEQAWSLIPEPRGEWDFYPNVMTTHVVKDLFPAEGGNDRLGTWLQRLREAYRDVDYSDLHVLGETGLALVRCGRTDDAWPTFERIFEVYGRNGFKGDLAPYLDQLLSRRQQVAVGAEADPVLPSPTPTVSVEAGSGSDELSEELSERVDDLAEDGNARFDDEGDWRGAIEIWEQGLALLPEPKNKWQAAMWFYASIGDAYRAGGEVGHALAAFESAYSCGDGFVNPLVLAGIGMCLFDLGRPDEAVDPLLRVYMLTGDDFFEDDNAKYLEFLGSRVQL